MRAEHESSSAGAGVYDAMRAAGNAAQIPGACPWCSGPHTAVMHGGKCPRVKAIEYHPDGTTKRVEFHEEARNG